MAEEQRLIEGITPKEEKELIAELDGALSARDKIESLKIKLAKHRENAYAMLKALQRPSVVHNGHVFKRETTHALSINKVKKEKTGKAAKDDKPADKFEPKSAAAAS